MPGGWCKREEEEETHHGVTVLAVRRGLRERRGAQWPGRTLQATITITAALSTIITQSMLMIMCEYVVIKTINTVMLQSNFTCIKIIPCATSPSQISSKLIYLHEDPHCNVSEVWRASQSTISQCCLLCCGRRKMMLWNYASAGVVCVDTCCWDHDRQSAGHWKYQHKHLIQTRYTA